MEDTALRRVVRRSASLDELAALVERIERSLAGPGCEASDHAAETGLPQPLERMERGVLHEWLCGDEVEKSGQPWTAPILIFAHLVRAAVDGDAAGGRLVVWIGRRVWPQPHVLRQSQDGQRDVLRRSLLIDPRSLDDRMWAIDLCLRSDAVSTVVADVTGMSMAQSRRLQLAAESGRALALLARPWNERKEHSAAARRWRIEPAPSPNASPRWRVELVRCKGVQRGYGMDAPPGKASTLIVEHDHATHCLRVPADVVDRSRPAAASSHAQPEQVRRTG